ncbi:MAG: alkaline phosphatase family protein [Acidimicrobiales bacterium]|jgi:predicted AlkP superfamily pyrophosphatase or phosphodiesterase|nr:alkaline phosphatase family protein [Acidimicrobiales bacterium]
MAVVDPLYRPDSDEHLEAVARAEAALLDPAMGHIVDMVLRVDGDAYEAASVEGRVRVRREADGTGWRYVEESVEGRNPLANQDADRFVPLAEERANPYPDRRANAYPFAYDQLGQLFDAPTAPDLIAIHTAAHNWQDQGGHLGEHGSIGVVQARAPFVLSGAGVRRDGFVPGAARLVDIAPTVLALLGAEPGRGVGANGETRHDALLARQDGEVLEHLLDDRVAPPEHVVGFLLDGANANVVYDLVRRGELPHIGRLLAEGVALEHGAMSSLPTVTLANHTSILTGAHPGHHGILHNAWWDRARREQVITNSQTTWLTAMTHLSPEVETLFDAVKRHRPGSLAVSMNEPCDTGADWSVFDLMRRGERLLDLPPAEALPDSTQRFVRPSKDYAWSSQVDHLATVQAEGIWGGEFWGRVWPAPRFCWVNFSLTDAAFHEGGPYSEMAAASLRDTDARIGRVLEAVERAGRLERTAFFLTADHGMEESNPEVRGNWADALDDSGVSYRDEGYSFIYVNP